MLRAVIFDVDGVLLDSFQANLKFFQNLLTRFGYAPPTPEQYKDLFHRPRKEVIGILAQSASAGRLEEIFAMSKEGRSELCPVELAVVPPGARETVIKLSKQYPLGIVTSRIQQSVFEVPQLAALREYFAVVVAYEDTQEHKPHPEPLLLAAQKLGVEPADAVYIGDVQNDIVAARAAGMKVVIYAPQPLPDADACVSSFAALPGAIAKVYTS